MLSSSCPGSSPLVADFAPTPRDCQLPGTLLKPYRGRCRGRDGDGSFSSSASSSSCSGSSSLVADFVPTQGGCHLPRTPPPPIAVALPAVADAVYCCGPSHDLVRCDCDLVAGAPLYPRGQDVVMVLVPSSRSFDPINPGGVASGQDTCTRGPPSFCESSSVSEASASSYPPSAHSASAILIAIGSRADYPPRRR